MPYITTNHRFIIDEKHPSDVFEEMENFFSLYTVEITDLQQVTIQLNIPENFQLNDNKKLAESYRNFIQGIRYTIPDVNVLTPKIRTHSSDAEQQNSAIVQDDNTLILLIQRYDGVSQDDLDEDKPSFYQRTLGKLLPKFESETTPTGLYPTQQPTLSIPEPQRPVVPQPVPVSQPQYQQPTQQQNQQPIQPVHTQTPVPPTLMPNTGIQQPNIATNPPQQVNVPPVRPVAPPQSINIQSNIQPPVQPARLQQSAIAPTQSLLKLPNVHKSAKPYQDLLTHAILEEAKKLLDKSQVINQITLKSSDSLTTAMIEQLFDSFNLASHDKSKAAHDSLDLVSYGYEVLKPKLAIIGVQLAEDAQFGLKSKAQTTAQDVARLERGEVFANEIKLGVKLIANSTANSAVPVQSNTANSASTSSKETAPQQTSSLTNPNLNANSQNITLIIKCIDELGERQQKVRTFPIVFASRDANANHAIRLFAPQSANLPMGSYFSIVELDGQVLLDNVNPNVTITRNGQTLTQGSILMPNDSLQINGILSVQLLLAN